MEEGSAFKTTCQLNDDTNEAPVQPHLRKYDGALFSSSRTVASASIISFQYPEESSFRRFSLGSLEILPDLVIAFFSRKNEV